MKKYSKYIFKIGIIIMMMTFVLVASPRQMQNDTFWSIKVGERLFKEGIFGIDTFSIHDGLYYVAHHFLTDVLIYLVYSFSGFTGLYIMEVILALIIAGLLYLLNKEISNSNQALSLIMTFLQMFIMRMYIAVRAQMVSYILFVLEILLLEKYIKKKKKRYVVGLTIIPIILANFHMGAAPFYFVILGVYISSLIRIKIPFLEYCNETDKERLKQLLIIVVIGILLLFVNPYGLDGVIYPFKTFGNDFINSNIQEFQNLTISFDGGWSLVYIALVMFVLIFSKDKIIVRDFLLIFGTLFMSFMAIRYVGLFIVCSSVILKYIIKMLKKIDVKQEDAKAIRGTLLIVFTIIVVILVVKYIKIDYEYMPTSIYPVEAVNFLKQRIDGRDKIFNEYVWGSYLMLNDVNVYIDSRCDMYTKEYSGLDIADDYNKLRFCNSEYKEIIEKYEISVFLIPVDWALATLLEENDEFQKIYTDDVAVIFKRK